MKIWIENPFDNLPVEGFRPQRYWLMARAFVRAGHSVVYWTSDFNHTTKKKRKLVESTMLEAGDEHIHLMMLSAPPYSKNVSVRRVVSHREYAREWSRCADHILEKDGRPDIIVTSMPPLATGDVAIALAKKCGAALIADVMDAWPETFYRLLPAKFQWLGKIFFAPFHRAARRLYASASRISGVCDRYEEIARAAGAREYRRFYHGITIAASKPPRTRNLASELRLVYVGNLGITYDLASVIAAVKEMDAVTLDIAGNGAQLEALTRLAEGCGRIRFRGYLGGDEMGALLAESDVGIVPMKSESFVGVPYKFGDYSAAGLAILSSLGGESAAMLERYGAGATYDCAQSLKSAVAAILPRIDEMKAASRRMAETEFDAGRIYDEYVKWATRA